MSTPLLDTEVEHRSRCLCGINSFCVKFRKADIPLARSLCHCNTCRHTTGNLAFSYLPIVGVPYTYTSSNTILLYLAESPHLRAYRTSDHKVRYFCATCASHLLCCTDNVGWSVSSGSLDTIDGLTTLNSHIWVGDTVDGGIATLIPSLGNGPITRFIQGPGSDELCDPWPVQDTAKQHEDGNSEIGGRVKAYCQCGDVRLYITRPNANSALPHSPYPDVLFPMAHTSEEIMSNKEDVKWWLQPPQNIGTFNDNGQSPSRYLAGHCVCNDCRLGSGFEVQSWAFVSRSNLFEEGSETPINFTDDSERPRGLRSYMSSPNTFREFCGTCGATVFWRNTDSRPDVIDVSVGLLDQEKNGVRAPEWLRWQTKRLSFIEVARATEFFDALKQGLSTVDPDS